MSVTVVIKFQAKKGQEQDLLGFLENLQPTVKEAGCKQISLHQDQNEPTNVFEIEEWDDAEGHQKLIEQAEASGNFEPLKKMVDGPFEVYYLDNIKSS